MKRVGLRLRLWLAVVLLTAAALAAAIVGFNLLLAGELDRSANSLARSRASAELDVLRIKAGKVVAPEGGDTARVGGSRVWIFTTAGAIELPLAPSAVTAAARAAAAGPSRFVDVPDADVRLFSQPVIAGGNRVGTVVTEVSLAPYEQTRKTALVGSLALAAVVVLLVAVAAWWLLRASLSPVRRMTRQAADWSEHDPTGRFALGEPHDDLTELAATLDTLLERVSASLRHEQRFSAELSHELRTPLAGLIAEAELALRRERDTASYRASLEQILTSARKLARTVDALVAAARAEAGGPRGTADAFAVVEEVMEACSPLAQQHGIMIEATPHPGALRVGVDADLAERILQPVVENACRYGRTHVTLTVTRREAHVVYTVEDDGPGVAPTERESIFEPGARGSAADDSPGAGLGLALARRLARSVAGDIEPVAGDGLGARFEIALPLA